MRNAGLSDHAIDAIKNGDISKIHSIIGGRGNTGGVAADFETVIVVVLSPQSEIGSG